ncbi:MAG: SNF2-related protein [Spirochaetota bacterium]
MGIIEFFFGNNELDVKYVNNILYYEEEELHIIEFEKNISNIKKLLNKFRNYEDVIIHNHKVELPQHIVYEIDMELFEELGIFEFALGLKFEQEGVFNRTPIKINLKLQKTPEIQLVYKKRGCFIETDGRFFIINKQQKELIDAVNHYNMSDETDDICKQAEIISVLLEKYRDKFILKPQGMSAIEKTIIPNEISVEFEFIDQDNLLIKPFFPDLEENDNQNLVSKLKQKHSNLVLLEKGVYAVLEDSICSTLDNIKKNNKVQGKENIKEVISNPEKFFPGITISDRIIGWGYVNLPSTGTEPSNIIWFKEDLTGGEKSFEIITVDGDIISTKKDDIESFIPMIEEAKKNNKETILIRQDNVEKEVKIAELEAILNLFSDKEKSEDNSSNNKEPKKSEFIITKDNIESENYKNYEGINKELINFNEDIFKSANINFFDFQMIGIKWLCSSFYQMNDNSGCLLADDMGLGKTLQILSFLYYLKYDSKIKKVLVISPKTLIDNWSSANINKSADNGEIEKFYKNEFTPLPIRNRDDMKYIKNENTDIVLASYDSIMHNCKTRERFLETFGEVDWDVIICDEAQQIKNPRTKRTVAVQSLKAKFKIACTATPIENKIDDLWTLYDWLSPGLLGTLTEFKKKYQIKNKKNDYKKIHDSLAERLNNYFIRRTKEEELKGRIPKKTIVVNKISITMYQKQKLEELMKVYRQAENSIFLEYIGKLIGIMGYPDFSNSSLLEENVSSFEAKSKKFEWLRMTLETISSNKEKVLIFTPSKILQRLLRKFILEKFNYDALIINGDVNPEKRLPEIKKCMEYSGFGCIILSPVVAGYGLTITEANHVIHFSRGWNPAKENQATDRVYRIGQKKPVKVYYPIVTFGDEKCYEFSSNDEYYESDIIIQDDPTPDENLDILIRKKGRLLKNFFSVTESIDQTELFQSFFHPADENQDDSKLNFFQILEVIEDNFEFEALAALIFEKMGFKTILTPKTSDYGVDVIVESYSEGNPLLLQVTKASNINKNIPINKAREIIPSKGIYEKSLGKKCNIGILTNGKVNKDDKILLEHKIQIFDLHFISKQRDLRFSIDEIKHRNHLRENIIE